MRPLVSNGMLVRRNHYALRGLYVALAVLLCSTLVLLVRIGLAYDGMCTSAIPEVGTPTPCSFWQYLSRNAVLLCLILAATHWRVVLATVLLPPIVGYVIDRRNRQAT